MTTTTRGTVPAYLVGSGPVVGHGGEGGEPFVGAPDASGGGKLEAAQLGLIEGAALLERAAASFSHGGPGVPASETQRGSPLVTRRRGDGCVVVFQTRKPFVRRGRTCEAVGAAERAARRSSGAAADDLAVLRLRGDAGLQTRQPRRLALRADLPSALQARCEEYFSSPPPEERALGGTSAHSTKAVRAGLRVGRRSATLPPLPA